VLRIDLHIGFGHRLHYDTDWELFSIRGVNALLGNNVGDFFLQIVQLVVSLKLRNLEFSFVQDFHYYLFVRKFPERRKILLLGNFSFRNICEYLIDLKDLIEVVFLLIAPVDSFVLVTSDFELFSSFSEPDNGDISESHLIDGSLNHI